MEHPKRQPTATSPQSGTDQHSVKEHVKDSYHKSMNFLGNIKRRISQELIGDEVVLGDKAVDGTKPPPSGPPPAGYAAQAGAGAPPAASDHSGFSLQGLSHRISNTISAPTSPAKHQLPQSQPQSMASQVQGLTKNLFQAATGRSHPVPDNAKTLLVIDNQNIDWSKYFRNKKILNDFPIRVEQADFSEITVSSFTNAGPLVDIVGAKTGETKEIRTFRPDFVLVRQPVRTESYDYRNTIIALLLGAVPSLNSLHSVYNFMDRPWVLAHLLMIQRRLGREKFPLLEFSYQSNFKELVNPTLPMVLKIGRGHKGVGKMLIRDNNELQDAFSLLAHCSQDFTTEPFIDAKYEIHVQRIGNSYKVFMRKGISDYWKVKTGSAVLEQIGMNDRYKVWVDEVCTLFGGLDICCVEALVDKDGREFIYKASDCSFTLLGDSQEEDRRQISELLFAKMNHIIAARQAAMRKGSAAAVALASKDSTPSKAPEDFIKHENPSYQPQKGDTPKMTAKRTSVPSTMPAPPPGPPPALPARHPPPPRPPPTRAESQKASEDGGLFLKSQNI